MPDRVVVGALKLLPEGEQGQFGSAGANDGQFAGPNGIDTDELGYFYVADSGNNRVQKFTPAGAYLAKFGTAGGGDGQLSNPIDLVVLPNGKVAVTDTGNKRIQIFVPAP